MVQSMFSLKAKKIAKLTCYFSTYDKTAAIPTWDNTCGNTVGKEGYAYCTSRSFHSIHDLGVHPITAKPLSYLYVLYYI